MSVVTDLIGGAAGGVINSVGGVVKTVSGDQSERDAAAAAEQLAVQQSYQSEWVVQEYRTWFDSAADGLNRLPRPTFTLGICALFAFACVNPPQFSAAMDGLAKIPEPLWIAIGTIIAFWFGGKFLQDAGFTKATKFMVAAPPGAAAAAAPLVQRTAMNSWLERRKAAGRES